MTNTPDSSSRPEAMQRAAPVFYSQHGEDAVLHEMFKAQIEGFFVEVGCIDGRRFSNTLTFEERGWRGICIEAHGDYIERLKINRPCSIVCHYAAGSTDEDDVPFYANRRGSLSTLDRSKEAEFRSHFKTYFSGFEIQRVCKRKLETIISRFAVPQMDILSIDVEGNEADVLLGLDLHHHRPRVIVVEEDTPRDENKIDAILLPVGYCKSVKIAKNAFYLLDKRMEAGLKNGKIKGTLIHTQHPLDEDGDRVVPFSFDFQDSVAGPKTESGVFPPVSPLIER